MKTLFTMGFVGTSPFGLSPYRPAYRLGQDAASLATMTLQKGDRDSLLANINRAAEENKAIAAFKQNANWQTLLGPDLAKFNDSLGQADSYSDTALAVQTRLSAPGTSWPLTGQEWNDSNSWILLIDQAFKLMQAHQPATAAKAGVTPPSGPTVSPVVLAVGGVAAVALLVYVLS